MGCSSKRQADGKPARTSRIELPSGGLWHAIIPTPLGVRDWISRQAAGVLVWMGGGAELLALIGILVGGLMLFVGPFRCLSAPAAARGRGLIIGSVVCQTLPVITFFGSFLLQISWLDLPAPTRGGPFEIAIAGLGLASQILFVLFMRRSQLSLVEWTWWRMPGISSLVLHSWRAVSLSKVSLIWWPGILEMLSPAWARSRRSLCSSCT